MTMEQKARIRIADTREPWIIQERLIETGWERQTVYTGDYWFQAYDFKRIGITRKTVNDLLSSIGSSNPYHKSKKFGQHLEDMLEVYDLRIMLLEGSWSQVKSSGSLITTRGIEYFTWDMIWDFLRTWQDKGFTLELTSNEGHTIRRLNRLYTYYQKPYHTGAITHHHSGDDRILAFPSGCRGKTAEAILSEYGSIHKVAEATIDELIQFEKVGKKKALAIYNHFNGDGKNEQLSAF